MIKSVPAHLMLYRISPFLSMRRRIFGIVTMCTSASFTLLKKVSGFQILACIYRKKTRERER